MASAAARGRLAQRRRTVAVGGNEAFEAQLLAQHLVEQGVRKASRLVVYFVVAEGFRGSVAAVGGCMQGREGSALVVT